MSTSGFVYFIEAVGADAIKIGIARNVDRRLQGHQVSCPLPLRLLASAPGGMEEEKHIHHRFAHLLVRGEWFSAKSEIMAFIAVVKETGALPFTVPHKSTTCAERIIQKFHGTRKMAALLNMPPSTIQSWKDAGRIPARKQSLVLHTARAASLDVTPADFFEPSVRAA